MPQAFLEDLKFGLEIEFLARTYVGDLLLDWVRLLPEYPINLIDADAYDTNKGKKRTTFALVSDSSIFPRRKAGSAVVPFELVSPVFELYELDMFRDVCAFFKLIRAEVSHTCGMHVHVGFPEEQRHQRYLTMRHILDPIGRKTTWKTRREFADENLYNTNHHCIIQKRSKDHFEVRLYNSSLKFRAIKNAVQSCARAAIAPLPVVS